MGTAKEPPWGICEGRAEGQPRNDFAERRGGENRERKPKMDHREVGGGDRLQAFQQETTCGPWR